VNGECENVTADCSFLIVSTEHGKGSTMYQYFIKVVPTIYESLDRRVIKTNQFAVTEYSKKVESEGHGLPGFSLDI
jgi:hypothetical protein